MKKPHLFLVIALCLGLSGCIDIFQYITKDTDGVDKNTIKVTISKVLLALADSFSDSTGSVDYEELFDELFADSELKALDVHNYTQYGAAVKRVNDAVDVGFMIEMNLDYRDRDTVNKINRDDTSFIPKYNGKNITLHIDCIGDGASVEENEMASAFLSAGKYRLMISKKCIAAVDKVTLKTPRGETEISCLELYDGYLVEVPISLIFISDVDVVIYSK